MPKGELTQIIDEQYKNKYITVSNDMIRARENTTLLESKIEALAMYYMDKEVKDRKKVDFKGNEYYTKYVLIPVVDVAVLMGRNDHGSKHTGGRTYQEISAAAVSMKKKFYIIEDREERRFAMISPYGDIKYDSGVLDIEFNPSFEKYFLRLKQNFSKYKLEILFSFTKNGGFQLYKLLKSYAYKPNLDDIDMSLPQEKQQEFKISWSLTDLRMLMGYVDLSQPLVKDEGSKSKPNWDKMERLEKHPQYSRWSDFKSRVIDPGVDEINKMSDIYIKEVIKDCIGKGGKVGGLTFVIQHNKGYYEKNSQAGNSAMESGCSPIIDEIRAFMTEDIGDEALMSIADAAGNDIGKIKKIYKMSKKSSNIKDIVGWMIAGLKNGYTESVGSDNPAMFDGFSKRGYDIDALEEEIKNK